MGHSAVEHLATYAHVIEAMSGQRYADLDALIAASRGGTLECPQSAPNCA